VPPARSFLTAGIIPLPGFPLSSFPLEIDDLPHFRSRMAEACQAGHYQLVTKRPPERASCFFLLRVISLAIPGASGGEFVSSLAIGMVARSVAASGLPMNGQALFLIHQVPKNLDPQG